VIPIVEVDECRVERAGEPNRKSCFAHATFPVNQDDVRFR
jgi:hypothetical protein